MKKVLFSFTLIAAFMLAIAAFTAPAVAGNHDGPPVIHKDGKDNGGPPTKCDTDDDGGVTVDSVTYGKDGKDKKRHHGHHGHKPCPEPGPGPTPEPTPPPSPKRDVGPNTVRVIPDVDHAFYWDIQQTYLRDPLYAAVDNSLIFNPDGSFTDGNQSPVAVPIGLLSASDLLLYHTIVAAGTLVLVPNPDVLVNKVVKDGNKLVDVDGNDVTDSNHLDANGNPLPGAFWLMKAA